MALLTNKTRVKPKFSVGKRQEEAKKSHQDELDDLCVVGYACKLFRDDARAREIDRGKHLIPWMGDEKLKIDRYDGRGHLHDLSDFDQIGWNEDCNLSSEAARIESICDEERYMALHKDLLEEQTRHEEELKRLNEAITSDGGYSAMQYRYGTGTDDYDPMQPTEDETETRRNIRMSHENQPPPSYQDEDATPADEIEEPFIAPPELKLPPGMEQPQTLKIHIIIEKTALFVSSQGTQMEIIVKTKQANNPQFDFLKFDHYLNPYYKLVVEAIKSKMYIPLIHRPASERKKQGEITSRRSSNSNSIQSDDDDESEMEGSGYLHPSLFAPPRPKPAAVQTQQHRPPSALQPDHIPGPVMGAHQGEVLGGMDLHHHHQQQQQAGLMGYYEGPPVTTSAPFPLPPMLVPPPPPPDHVESVQLGHHMGGPPAPQGYLPPAAEPQLAGPVLAHHHPGLVPSMQPHDPTQPPPHPHGNPASVLGPPLISQEMPIPPAADESAIEAPSAPIVPPPPDIQPIIDKLAKYVAKNGDEFEASVRGKCDPRFEFLVPWHSYNAYYLAKKRMFVQEFTQGAPPQPDIDDISGRGGALEKNKKVPVRFPIKPKRAEERTLGKKSALPVESSSESEGEDGDRSTSANGQQGRGSAPQGLPHGMSQGMPHGTSQGLPHGMSQGMPLQGLPQGISHQGLPRGIPHGVPFGSRVPTQSGMVFSELQQQQQYGMGAHGGEEDYSRQGRGYGDIDIGDVDDDDDDYDDGSMDASKKAGGAQQCMKDRLAKAARRKLASESHERNRQVERRKRLALFLSQVKDRPQAAAAAAAAAQDGGMPDPEREMPPRADPDRSRSSSKPRSPSELVRGERASSSPPQGSSGDTRSRQRAAPVPKSYQKAVNREVVERERRRKRHSRSRSPSPHKTRKKSPPAMSAIGAGSSAIIGRSSSASPVMSEPYPEPSLTLQGSELGSTMSSMPNTQPSVLPSDSKPEPKANANDLRAKIRAMLQATMRSEEVG